jgi:hypothetical protein
VKILLTIRILTFLNDLKSLIGVGVHLRLKLRRQFGLSEFHLFFLSAVFEVSGAGAKHFYVRVCESSIQTYTI